jgi:hypothetical protein
MRILRPWPDAGGPSGRLTRREAAAAVRRPPGAICQMTSLFRDLLDKLGAILSPILAWRGRSVVIGLLLGTFLAFYGYRNDWILKQTYVASDLLPFSVYGFLVFGLLILNPLLAFWHRRLAFRAWEWGVIVSLMLVACVIPGPGLEWTFHNALVMPYHHAQKQPSWRDKQLLSYAPNAMLVDLGDPNTYDPNSPLYDERYPTYQKFRDHVITDFRQPMGTAKRWTDPDEVPWRAWYRPFGFWLPLLGLSFVGSIALVLLVHRQWSHRERLRYPIAEMVCELYQGAGEGKIARIFRNRVFWLGFVPAFAVLVLNGAKTWEWVELEIPLGVNMQTQIQSKWPKIQTVPGWGFAFATPTLIFAALGFAYFLSGEVSFSLGVSHILFGVLWFILYESGAELKSEYFAGGPHPNQLFGSYLGMGLMVVYIGRRFYGDVLLRALGLRSGAGEPADRDAVWACRVVLLCAAAMTAMLIMVGLNWLLAVLVVLLTGLLFLIVTRINVEAGLFFIQPSWHAVGILLGLFGIAALGPKMLIILAILSAVMTLDPRVCLMPMAANGLRFSEAEGVRPGRLAPWMGVAILLALAAGTVGTLYWQYNDTGAEHAWLDWGAVEPYKMLERNLDTLKDRGELTGEPQNMRFRIGRWFDRQRGQWLPTFHGDKKLLYYGGAGLALVLVCSFFRLRYQWWPLHPVIFLVWGTMPMSRLAPSFLLGWAVKGAITKFGGGQAYRKYKPFFVGLIAGSLLAGLFWQIAGVVYYQVNELAPPTYKIHW